MQFMDLDLAHRAEQAEASAARACAEALRRLRPEFPVDLEEIAGGIAVFAGVDSPITQAIGVGLDGPANDSDFERLETFFRSHNAPTAVELCPFADPSFYEGFGKRGYRLTEVSNVLVRDMKADEQFGPAVHGLIVRQAAAGEEKLWTLTVAQGFAEHFPVTESILSVMQGFFHRADARCFLAFAGREVAGGGAVAAHEGVGGLFGASTLPNFRRRGVQAALVNTRLAWARAQKCDIAVTITQPGSASQRNMERASFRVAYTRTKLVREWS